MQNLKRKRKIAFVGEDFEGASQIKRKQEQKEKTPEQGTGALEEGKGRESSSCSGIGHCPGGFRLDEDSYQEAGRNGDGKIEES